MLMATTLQAKEAKNAGPEDFIILSQKLNFSSFVVKFFFRCSLTISINILNYKKRNFSEISQKNEILEITIFIKRIKNP